MIILVLTIVCFLIYLIIERIYVEHWLKAIPLRISVTGTRGKTTLVRMVAGVLRDSGQQVLAKTTGSEAKFILPDGSEQDVPRRGMPTILEQKKLLKMAVKLKANCIVAEVMSIHPENHFVESQQLLRPNIVMLTNIRLDHIDAMGHTEDQMASVFGLDLPPGATLCIPSSELRPPLIAACQRQNIELIICQEDQMRGQLGLDIQHVPTPVAKHIALISALGRHLGIDEKTISNGIRNARTDIGGLKIWTYRPSHADKTHFLINAFAANDPMSTREILEWVKVHLPLARHHLIGLLNLRADRGDRTLQWIKALNTDPTFNFKQLFIIGSHTKPVNRMIPSAKILPINQPAALMDAIFSGLKDDAVIFGCGNIGGMGRLLVAHWNQIGEAYGI